MLLGSCSIQKQDETISDVLLRYVNFTKVISRQFLEFEKSYQLPRDFQVEMQQRDASSQEGC